MHMRMHCKENEAQETIIDGKIKFIKPKAQYVEPEMYAKLGSDPTIEQPKGVWEIPNISNELPMIDINQYFQTTKLDPKSYFVTSGEAVKKAEKLVKDAFSLAIKARSFKDKLIEARGNKQYLETSWENNKLIVKTKEKRNKNVEEEIKEEIKEELNNVE